jgi:catechol 2,3-dioxygenase-like lactoylglutathione lyase family enzyme
MLNLSTTQVWVRDQDEALAFWTDKVGFEIKEDVTVAELGNFRWLTVGPQGQDGTAIVLMAIPGPPVMDDATKAQVEEIAAKGFATALFFTTDELVANGVEVLEKPIQQPYGIDFGFRDPTGNHYRVAQRFPMG